MQSRDEPIWRQRIRAGCSKLLQEPHAAQRFFARRSFRLFERGGIHVTADHFYEPVPNLTMVSRTHVDAPRVCLGIDLGFEDAERLALALLNRWACEFLPSAHRVGFRERNLFYAGVDAALLYCFVRERKPMRVVEIGQGVSTSIMVAALQDNARETGLASVVHDHRPIRPSTELERGTRLRRRAPFGGSANLAHEHVGGPGHERLRVRRLLACSQVRK